MTFGAAAFIFDVGYFIHGRTLVRRIVAKGARFFLRERRIIFGRFYVRDVPVAGNAAYRVVARNQGQYLVLSVSPRAMAYAATVA